MNGWGILLIILLIIILVFFFAIAIPILIIIGIAYLIYYVIKSLYGSATHNNNNNNTIYYENFNETTYGAANGDVYSTWYEPVQDYYDATVNGLGNVGDNSVLTNVSEHCFNKKFLETGNFNDAIASCTMSGAVSGSV